MRKVKANSFETCKTTETDDNDGVNRVGFRCTMENYNYKVYVLVWFFIVWISGVFVTVRSSPVVDEDNKGFRYEEYLIEHEISSAQAKKALMAINFTTGKLNKKLRVYKMGIIGKS